LVGSWGGVRMEDVGGGEEGVRGVEI